MFRKRDTLSAVITSPRSTVRCSTRPLSVISTSIIRAGVNGTSSMCRTVECVKVGYWMIATCRVSCANSRTLRRMTSSRSIAPSRNSRIARRSAADSGLTSVNRSTNSRYPLSVGTRPALVCGCAMYPSSSSEAMSLRTVALETPRLCRSTIALEATGSWLDT